MTRFVIKDLGTSEEDGITAQLFLISYADTPEFPIFFIYDFRQEGDRPLAERIETVRLALENPIIES